MFHSEREALQVLSDRGQSGLKREEAAAYLEQFVKFGASGAVVKALVQALGDDDLGVRWAAGAALSQIGVDALPQLLDALTDPSCAGDSRVRSGAHRVLLHLADNGGDTPAVRAMIKALEGPASDLATMEEAAHWRQVLNRKA